MARPWRPASEHFQSSISQVTASHEAWLEGEEEEEDAPIFSLSKSSVDVLMSAGPLQKWDPALTRRNIRRSSSTNTNTHTEENSCTLQQLRAHARQQDNTAHTQQLPHRSRLGQACGSPPLGEHWIANVERWSVCSGGAWSDSSTPETVVWRGGAILPQSLFQEAPFSQTPDSSSSNLASPNVLPSPLVSPLQTSPLTPTHFLFPSTLLLETCRQQEEDIQMPLSTPEVHASSTMPPSPLLPNSPDPHQLPSMENECIPTNSLLPSFTLPTHCPMTPSTYSISPEEGAGLRNSSPQHACLVDGSLENLRRLALSPGSTHSVVSEEGMAEEVFMPQLLGPQIEEKVLPGPNKLCHLELPWQPGQCGSSDFSFNRRWRSPLVSSLSDSGLSNCCRCNSTHSRLAIMNLVAPPRPEGGRDFGNEINSDEGTVTSHLKLVDAAVQTISPPGSWWNLRRNMSYMSNSNMGSHSILGSPPGSRLNLRSSLGSNSNLVSPSSSMFLVESGEEKGEKGEPTSPVWEVSSPPVYSTGRRRSCLKVQGEEQLRSRLRDEHGRRSSMKQVQWDEDGMMWDVYGTSLDPQELSLAMQRHLDSQGPRQPKQNSSAGSPRKQTKAQVRAPDPRELAMVETATATAEGNVEGRVTAESELEKDRNTKREPAEDVCGKRKAVPKKEKGGDEGEQEDIHREKGTLERKSSCLGNGRSLKKGVMRSLKKPRWCGGSSKDNS